MKGFDTMNKNRVFETVITSTDRFDSFALPKDAKRKVRTAKVGAGVVVLPDNGADITDSEIVKALGLKDFEPEEERTNIIIERFEESPLLVSLTKSQIRLLNWLDTYGLLNDMEYGDVNNSDFEKI
jgi:hypothetical protein